MFLLWSFDSAIYYGLPLVPAYLGLSQEEKNSISTGINYASAGCGILPQTGRQIVSFSNILQKNICIIGFKRKSSLMGFICMNREHVSR